MLPVSSNVLAFRLLQCLLPLLGLPSHYCCSSLTSRFRLEGCRLLLSRLQAFAQIASVGRQAENGELDGEENHMSPKPAIGDSAG